MELEKIIDVCFFVGIVCGIIGFSIAKLYYMAALMLFIAVGTIYSVSSNNDKIELIIQKDKG